MPGWRAVPVVYAIAGNINNFDASPGGTAAMSSVFFSTVTSSGGAATIGSLFYMLVKYQDVSPKQFICKGDSGSEVFKLTSYTTTTITDLTKVYDFGTRPGKHCSYAYHFPFARSNSGTPPPAGFPISVSSAPSSPLAADRNPGLDKNASAYVKGGDATGSIVVVVSPPAASPCINWGTNNSQYVDKDFVFNAYAHQREGQNVLYNDGHVKFESQANVGINNDNIYQRWPTANITAGTIPTKDGLEACGRLPSMNAGNTQPATYTDLAPADITDALLINDILDGGKAG
jgi:hypothetical protein